MKGQIIYHDLLLCQSFENTEVLCLLLIVFVSERRD